LLALAVAAGALALFAGFETRGIAWLGALEGPELGLAVLERGASVVRATLALLAATAAGWAVGLLAIEASYDAGQVVSDLSPWVHVSLRQTADGLQLVLVNLGQDAVEEAQISVRLPDGVQVDGVTASSPDDDALAVEHAVENGYLRLTLADLPVLTLIEVRLG
jgi:hypothetical protein